MWADLDGYAVAHNMGYLQELPLDRFTNFVWHMLTRNSESREVETLRAKLWQPPKGEIVTDARSPWSSKNEGESFSAFKRGMGG